MKRFIPSALFAVALIGFMMPFLLLSACGQTVSVSGLKFATGGSAGPVMARQNLASQPSVVAALWIAIAGVGMGLIAARWRHAVSAVAGLVGALSLYFWSNVAMREAQQQGAHAERGIGLNTAMIFFALAAAVSAYFAAKPDSAE